jgi:hypothetical protein
MSLSDIVFMLTSSLALWIEHLTMSANARVRIAKRILPHGFVTNLCGVNNTSTNNMMPFSQPVPDRNGGEAGSWQHEDLQ